MTEHNIIQALGVHLYLKYICIPNVLMFGDNPVPYDEAKLADDTNK